MDLGIDLNALGLGQPLPAVAANANDGGLFGSDNSPSQVTQDTLCVCVGHMCSNRTFVSFSEFFRILTFLYWRAL